ncbi:hypothetical protein G6F55_014211 [Rhizopus delemar]|nr:hypothetical protein G6F55_014211 [Rhizopus delemar]
MALTSPAPFRRLPHNNRNGIAARKPAIALHQPGHRGGYTPPGTAQAAASQSSCATNPTTINALGTRR